MTKLRWIHLLKYRSYEFDIWYGAILGRLKFVWFHRNDRGSQEYYCQRTLGLDGVEDNNSYLLSDADIL